MHGQISIFDKPRIKFTEDVFTLCEDFKKGTEWEIYMEQENNYIIHHKSIFYGPLRSECERV